MEKSPANTEEKEPSIAIFFWGGIGHTGRESKG